MFLTVFGVPTATVQLGLRLVQGLVRASAGEFDLLMAGTLDELRDGWRGTGKRYVLYFHESPDGRVLSFFKEAGAPILLFADDPVNVALALNSERGIELAQACRMASVSASLYEDLAGYKSLLQVDAHSDTDLTLGRFFDAISSFFDLTVDQGLFDSFVTSLSDSDAASAELDQPWVAVAPGGGISLVPFVEQVAAERYLASYRSLMLPAGVTRIAWPRELFIVGNDASMAADRVLDMTGGRRVLLQGPWCGLPRGRWKADIEFEVFGNRMGCDMAILVVAESTLRHGTMSLPASGLHSCSIEFDHLDPRWPVAMQFIPERGVVQGEFVLRGVTLRRMATS